MTTTPAAYAVTIANRLYGYGETISAAVADFGSHIAGATRAQQYHLRQRKRIAPLDADAASEVAHMLDQPAKS